MIITIERAILHICGAMSGNAIFSEKTLDITDNETNSYITNHIKRVYEKEPLRKGQITDNSNLKSFLLGYINKDITFEHLSEKIGKDMYENYSMCDKPEDLDLLIAEIRIANKVNPKTTLCILNLKTRKGYSHEIRKGNLGLINSFMNNNAILPFMNQTVTECAFIDMDTFNVMYMSKGHSVDGERTDIFADNVLNCICVSKSSKETLKGIEGIIKTEADTSEAAVDKAVEFKQNIINRIENGLAESPYTVEEVAEHIFSEPTEQNKFVEAMKRKGLISNSDDTLPVDDYFMKKIGDKVRIVTNNGIEIKFPVMLYQKENGIQIKHETEDKTTIIINGINKYELK